MEATIAPDTSDPPASFDIAALTAQPGLIWGCARTEAGTVLTDDRAAPPDHGFRWLHLNLGDQRSHRWIERATPLPPALHALLLSPSNHPRMAIEGGMIGLVLEDFERGFEKPNTNEVGTLHAVLGPSLMLTGRYRPVRSPDLIRQRIAQGADVMDGPAALDLLLSGVVDGISGMVLDVGTDLLTAEDEFLAHQQEPDTRQLVSLRRRAAQLHRMVASMRATLHRLESDPALPMTLAPVAARFSQRLQGLDTDIVAAQTQLKLLRDELDLQATQRTNENLYLLSIMTALMMPATLVTGFFGMNTGGLPFTAGLGGTWSATIIAVAASAATYFLLRALGLVRR